MDKERKKILKKQAKMELEERSRELKAKLAKSNPLPMSHPNYMTNVKKLIALENQLRKNQSEIYSDRMSYLMLNPVDMDIRNEYLPVEGYYLHCKSCGDLVPMRPKKPLRCLCGSIILDTESKKIYIDYDRVEVVKLIAKIPPLCEKIVSWCRNVFSNKNRYQSHVSRSHLSIDSINKLANQMQKEGRFSKLESELERIDIDDLNQLEKQSWYLFYGITAMQRNAHHEALKRFSKGAEQFPSNQELMFSLGQEYIYLNQPDEAFSEFDKCKFPTLSSHHILTMSNFAYLFNEYERGINYLNQFIDIYFKIKILDDTFLYIRGIPFFSSVWNAYVGFHILLNDKDNVYDIFNNIKETCSDYDFDNLKLELDAYCTNNFDVFLEHDEKILEKNSNSKFPMGFTKTKVACFRSFRAVALKEAYQFLDSVTFNENDTKWLQDMLTLAKARAANHFGEKLKEEAFIKEFIKKQPLLFELSNIISFGLLKYQDMLKSYILPIK